MKYSVFFIILFLKINLFAANDIDPAFKNLCSNVDKLSQIGNVIKKDYWPSFTSVPPWGGVVSALTSNQNVIYDICQFVNSYSEWSTKEKIYNTKQFLNNLTNRKHDEDLEMFNKTYNIAESVYDFDSGKGRKGALKSKESQEEMIQYYKDLQEYNNRKKMTKADEYNNQSQYSREIDDFSKVVEKRTNYAEAVNCPDASQNPDYEKLYEKNKIEEARQNQEKAENDMKYYKEKLMAMADFMFSNDTGSSLGLSSSSNQLAFSRDYYNYNSFMFYLNDLEKSGVYIPSPEETYYLEKTMKTTDRRDSKGIAIKEEVGIKTNYQIFKMKLNDNIFSIFFDKYNKKWTDTVTQHYLTYTSEYGALAGADKRVENKFRDFSYECREEDLMKGWDYMHPEYNSEFKKRYTECIATDVVAEKKALNIFDYYIRKYKEALIQERTATVKIWNFESRYLGIHRFLKRENILDNVQKENVKCSEELSLAEMDTLEQKLLSSENEYKEIIAKNKIKKNLKEEAKDKAEQDYIKDQEKKSLMAEKKRETMLKSDRKATGSFVAPIGGFGKKSKK